MGTKTIRFGMIGALVVGGAVDVASAATITWSSAIGITSPGTNPTSDISTTGTAVAALDFGSTTTPITDNGVTFTGAVASATVANGNPLYYSATGASTDPIVVGNYPSQGSGEDDYSGGSAPSTADSNYNTLLSRFIFGYNASDSFTVTFNGLTQGDTYQIQVLVEQENSGVDTNGTTIVAGPTLYGNAGSGLGQYALGTFTADATLSQAFSYGQAVSGTNPAEIDAIQIRQIAAVPEPATIGAIFLGFAGTTLRRRRRTNSASPIKGTGHQPKSSHASDNEAIPGM
jgi:hypothetical protein